MSGEFISQKLKRSTQDKVKCVSCFKSQKKEDAH